MQLRNAVNSVTGLIFAISGMIIPKQGETNKATPAKVGGGSGNNH